MERTPRVRVDLPEILLVTAGASCLLCDGATEPETELCSSCRLEVEDDELGRARAVCLADVEPEDVQFLWEPRIPLGKLTILEGDPGEGKSFITAALAAAVSRGEALPGSAASDPGRALLFTAEDGLGDTVRPRMESLGADLLNVHAYSSPLNLGTEDDRHTVHALIQEHRPVLVVFDPITAYLGIRTDTHRANEVRSILAPLAQLAERHGCAVLVVRHLAKGKSGRAIYKGLGSIDFTAAARSVLLAGSSASDREERALIHLKSNLAAKAPALGYRVYGEAGQSRFEWTGESTLTASDLVAEEQAGAGGRITEGREFLRQMLADGPVPVKEIRKLAKDAGIADRTLDIAKSREGVASQKGGFTKGWFWTLPDTKDAR